MVAYQEQTLLSLIVLLFIIIAAEDVDVLCVWLSLKLAVFD